MASPFDSFSALVDVWVLHQLTVLFIGAGRVGLNAMLELAPLGFRQFIAADSGFVGARNVAFGYRIGDIRKRKVTAAGEILNGHNPKLKFQAVYRKVTRDSLAFFTHLIDQAHLVVLAIEAFDMMAALARIAYPHVPTIAGTLMHDGALGEVGWSWPGATPCLECSLELSQKSAGHGGNTLPSDVRNTTRVTGNVAVGLCLRQRDLAGFDLFHHYIDPRRCVLYVVNRPSPTIRFMFDDVPDRVHLAEVVHRDGGGPRCSVCRGYRSSRF